MRLWRPLVREGGVRGLGGRLGDDGFGSDPLLDYGGPLGISRLHLNSHDKQFLALEDGD